MRRAVEKASQEKASQDDLPNEIIQFPALLIGRGAR